MKSFMFLVIVCVLGLATLSNAQQSQPQQQVAANNPPTSVVSAPDVKANPSPALEQPKWPGRVYLESPSGLIQLEGQTPVGNMKVKALGFGGGSFAFLYTGVSSPVRAAQSPTFQIRLDPSEDPAVSVSLNQVIQDKEKGSRKILAIKSGTFGAKTSTVTDIKLDFENCGNGVAKILVGPLAPGEYAFRTKSGVTYLFGVD